MYKTLNVLENKNILLCVTGSIAAYKACSILRILKKSGSNVHVMMSESAINFIGKATLSALSNNDVITDLFPESPKAGLEHIQLSLKLDAIVIAPATANILCKVANGIADDIISTTLSVCEQPILFAPAMNNRMWQNNATQEAVEKLRSRDKIVMNPSTGQLASLHEGEGRLPNITDIINKIRQLFNIRLPLKGKRILVTAGPTREIIDPVRFISNRSSGKMGYAIANTAIEMGAEVILVSGPVSISPHPTIKIINVESSFDMLEAVIRNCKKADYIFMTSAVADYTIKEPQPLKIKRNSNNKSIELIPAPDILKSIIGKTKAKVIAFALETHNGKKEALRKLIEKNAEVIVLNYANEDGAGFESNTNRVTLFSKNGKIMELKKDRKDRIAKKIIRFCLSVQK